MSSGIESQTASFYSDKAASVCVFVCVCICVCAPIEHLDSKQAVIFVCFFTCMQNIEADRTLYTEETNTHTSNAS